MSSERLMPITASWSKYRSISFWNTAYWISRLRTVSFLVLCRLMNKNRAAPKVSSNSSANGRYRNIRQLINSGAVEQALAQLNAIPEGANDAEWNFLMGRAYYYKGWVAEALRYFEAACRLAPGNPEYEAALRNLRNQANGAMPGNPYGNPGPYGTQAVSCSCCDMCAAWMCMDMCCSCSRGC